MEGIKELLFPNTCVICEDLLIHQEKGICSICRFNLPYSSWNFTDENPVVKALWGRCAITAGFHLLSYRKGSFASSLVHAIKYQNQQQLAIAMGEQMGEKLMRTETYKTLDFVVSVPMHPKKKKNRGYNQAELIASGISRVIDKPFYADFLLQTRNTQTQTLRDRLARQENAGDKYQWNVNFPSESINHILLVDDVMTTGSTLEAAEFAIRKQFKPENVRVSIATLAYVF